MEDMKFYTWEEMLIKTNLIKHDRNVNKSNSK